MLTTIEQKTSLIKETETSILLIRHGLAHLQALDFANDFYHLPMLLLANGFERLLKIIICLHTLEQTGSFPSEAALRDKKRGHNLLSMMNIVADECFTQAYLKVGVAQDDQKFLKDDQRLREIICILSDFGQGGRYHDLNVVGSAPNTDAPAERWARLELSLLRDNLKGRSDLRSALASAESAHENYRKTILCLVIYLERLARGVTRLVALGGLGKQVGGLSGIIAPFLQLKDSDFGTRDYHREIPSQ